MHRRHRTPPGGGGESDDLEEATLLPPIGGGAKGHKSAKTSFKGASSSNLQKPSMSMHSTTSQSSHVLGAMGSSKGLSGALGTTGMSSVSSSGLVPMGHTASHPWVQARAAQERNQIGSRASGGANEKMNSTWGPSQQPRKDISPVAAHKLARESSKKR